MTQMKPCFSGTSFSFNSDPPNPLLQGLYLLSLPHFWFLHRLTHQKLHLIHFDLKNLSVFSPRVLRPNPTLPEKPRAGRLCRLPGSLGVCDREHTLCGFSAFPPASLCVLMILKLKQQERSWSSRTWTRSWSRSSTSSLKCKCWKKWLTRSSRDSSEDPVFNSEQILSN